MDHVNIQRRAVARGRIVETGTPSSAFSPGRKQSGTAELWPAAESPSRLPSRGNGTGYFAVGAGHQTTSPSIRHPVEPERDPGTPSREVGRDTN